MAVKTLTVYSCDRCGKRDLAGKEVFTETRALVSVSGKRVINAPHKSKKHYCEACARQLFDLQPTDVQTATAPATGAKRGPKPKAKVAEAAVSTATADDEEEDDE